MQIKLERKFNNPGQDCYEAVQKALTSSGFQIWKTREIAYLVIANKEEAGKTVAATAMVMGSQPAAVTLSLDGEGLLAEALNQFGEEIFSELEKVLSKG
jgi:hypothetical protein